MYILLIEIEKGTINKPNTYEEFLKDKYTWDPIPDVVNCLKFNK